MDEEITLIALEAVDWFDARGARKTISKICNNWLNREEWKEDEFGEGGIRISIIVIIIIEQQQRWCSSDR